MLMPGVAGLPYGYIHGYKKPVFDHTLFSWGETCIGSLDGPPDASAGAGATIGGWCAWQCNKLENGRVKFLTFKPLEVLFRGCPPGVLHEC
jgi:hypothetical protein